MWTVSMFSTRKTWQNAWLLTGGTVGKKTPTTKNQQKTRRRQIFVLNYEDYPPVCHIYFQGKAIYMPFMAEEEKETSRATRICNQFQYCEKLLNLLQWTNLWPRFTFWKFFRTLFAVFRKFFPCQLFALKCKLQQKSWTLILGLALHILRY